MSTSDSPDTRPPKRPRTSQGCPTPPSSSTKSTSYHKPLKGHAEFWFDDGSIILVARNTGFRVYRALLATQSPILAGLFSSSTNAGAEMLDDCPVVHLSDEPLDVAHFLRVLLPGSQLMLYTTTFSFSFHQISAVIRLAHKYAVPAVLDQAIAALEQSFPSDFATWERGRKPLVALEPAHAIGVVRLAWLVDRPSLLPLAFYKCALLGGAVVDGYIRENKSVERLDREDLKRCIEGRNALAERAVGVVLDVFGSGRPREDSECAAPDACRPLLRSIFENAVYDDRSTDVDALQSWKEVIDIWAPEQYAICAHCKKGVLDREVASRKCLWDSLSEMFDLWDCA